VSEGLFSAELRFDGEAVVQTFRLSAPCADHAAFTAATLRAIDRGPIRDWLERQMRRLECAS
jgi:hypothetical protein